MMREKMKGDFSTIKTLMGERGRARARVINFGSFDNEVFLFKQGARSVA